MGFRTLATDGGQKISPVVPSSVTITTTGTINNLDFSNADYIRMNNATDATINGLLAGSEGQEVWIESIGAGNVFFQHQNTGSTAANRLINLLTTWQTPLGAGKGVAKYKYDATTARWRLVAHRQGANVNIAYASGNYSSDVGTWTVDSGDQTTLAYCVFDKHIKLSMVLNTTSVSGTPVILIFTMPGQSAESIFILIRALDNVVGKTGMFRVVATDTALRIYVDTTGGSTWTNATNATYVQGYIWFEGV